MNLIIKAIALIAVELVKHYTNKIGLTHIEGSGPGEREKKLRDKIRNRWKNRK